MSDLQDEFTEHSKPATSIEIDLPEELIALCDIDNITSERVLKGFIADLCKIFRYVDNPRADGYSSNGSDERDMAGKYYDRCGYSMDREERLKARESELAAEITKLNAQSVTLEKMAADLQTKMDALDGQHDPDGGTNFEDEPWYPQWEQLHDQHAAVDAAFDRIEDQLAELYTKREQLDMIRLELS